MPSSASAISAPPHPPPPDSLPPPPRHPNLDPSPPKPRSCGAAPRPHPRCRGNREGYTGGGPPRSSAPPNAGNEKPGMISFFSAGMSSVSPHCFASQKSICPSIAFQLPIF